VADSLREVGFQKPSDLMSTYAGRNSDLRNWTAGAHINGDMDLRLQYMAGMGLNFNDAPTIKAQISDYFRYPDGMFKGSPEEIAEIQQALH
jgi:spermidine synthase